MDSIHQQIASRFGNGVVARAAAQKAFNQLNGGEDPEMDAMFEFRNPVPSGLSGQQDLLLAEAFGRAGSKPGNTVDQYPYRDATHASSTSGSDMLQSATLTSIVQSPPPSGYSQSQAGPSGAAVVNERQAASGAATASAAAAGPSAPPSAAAQPPAAAPSAAAAASQVLQSVTAALPQLPTAPPAPAPATGGAAAAAAAGHSGRQGSSQSGHRPTSPAPAERPEWGHMRATFTDKPIPNRSAQAASSGRQRPPSPQMGRGVHATSAATGRSSSAGSGGHQSYEIRPTSPRPPSPLGVATSGSDSESTQQRRYAADPYYPERSPGSPRSSADIIKQATGRSGVPNHVTSPHNRVGMASIARRSATRLSSDSSRSPSPASPRSKSPAQQIVGHMPPRAWQLVGAAPAPSPGRPHSASSHRPHDVFSRLHNKAVKQQQRQREQEASPPPRSPSPRARPRPMSGGGDVVSRLYQRSPQRQQQSGTSPPGGGIHPAGRGPKPKSPRQSEARPAWLTYKPTKGDDAASAALAASISSSQGGEGGGAAAPAAATPDEAAAMSAANAMHQAAVAADQGHGQQPNVKVGDTRANLLRSVHTNHYLTSSRSPSPSPGPRSPRSPGSSPGMSPQRSGGWTEQGFVSASLGRETREREVPEEEYYHKFRIKQHHDDQPDFKYSQPRSSGPHVTLAQHMFSFDEAHPGIAAQHYLRTSDQNELLDAERRVAAMKKLKAAKAASRGRSPTSASVPSLDQLRGDVHKLSAVRDAGRGRLRQLEQESEALRHASRSVQQRAMDAIANSERITQRMARSPSPGRSPGRGSSPGAMRPTTAAPYISSPYTGASPVRYTSQSMSNHGGVGRSQHQDAYVPDQGMAAHVARPVSAPGWMTQQLRLSEGQYMPDHGAQPGAGDDSEGADDYVVRDAGARLPGSAFGGSAGPALTEDEFRLAAGAFDPVKYEEYNRQMDLEMEQRAIQRGYESDAERERRAQAEVDAMTEEERAEAERKAKEATELASLLQQTWQEQDNWMDYYRQRLGPGEGYQQYFDEQYTQQQMFMQQQGGSTSDSGALGQGRGQYLADMRSPSPMASRSHGALSDGDEELVASPFVPVLSPGLGVYPDGEGGYISDGPTGYRRVGAGGGRSGSAGRSPFKSTVPKPFTFEERAASRPKTIMRVKMEQDLAIKRQEEAAAKKYRFRAHPIPNSTLEPKYERMMLEAEVRRQMNKDQRMEELQQMVEQPFSFQARDEAQAALKEAVAAAAKDPNRFQVPFRAKDAPKTVKAEKFKMMQYELEAKRAGARARIEAARQKAREKVEQDTKQRQDAATKAYKERLRAIDPIWNQKYDTKPLGAVPDFNLLHRQWEQRMATLRALNRRHVVPPHEFQLNGGTSEERAARERKALERRQRIILDMQLDEELLPEMRWPHKMPRGRVRPAPPPPLEQPDLKVSDTRANMLRRAATQTAKRGGQYDSRKERDRKALEAARQEAIVRAQLWMKVQHEIQKKKMVEGDVDLSALNGSGKNTSGLDAEIAAGGVMGDDKTKTTAARRAALEGRSEVPMMHIEARHAQVEKRVKEMVEDALLQQGLDAYKEYKYTEG